LEFLSFLEDHDLFVAVATSSDGEYAELSLQRAGLSGRFGVVVTGDQVARGKPARHLP
jgi:beta-phosphoglucomutase-like phosphatase (HAD superfamily)